MSPIMYGLFFHVQFTSMPVAREVGPGEQVTLEYRFLPPQQANNDAHGFTLLLSYKSLEKEYKGALFNGTVEFTESRLHSDFASSALLILAIGGIAIFVASLKFALAKPTRPRRAIVSSPVSDWLAGTNATKRPSSKS